MYSLMFQLYGVTTNPLAIVTEFLEKGSLLSYLQSKQLITAEVRAKIILGIARGMLHLVSSYYWEHFYYFESIYLLF